MSLRFPLSFACLSLFASAAVGAAAPTPTAADRTLEQQFTDNVRPFLETFCVSCHSADKPEAELDLSPYSTMSRVVADYSHWELVLERLDAAEMPPTKAEKHPTVPQREAVVAWIQAMRKNEADKNAGDPGPVLARRLSNAEYDYTVRDLTGVDIRPTKEFPVDPANQAGFDNTGESLAMSPALLKKYLHAARTVSEHLILKPEGFAFAPHPVVADTDRDKWGVLRIVDFYGKQPTDLADYFAAAWRYQHRAALGQPEATLADIAAQTKVSAKYLTRIWSTLSTPEEVGPIARLQTKWRELPAPSGPARSGGTVALPASGGAPGAVREGAIAMRDYVSRLREKIVPEVKNLSAPQIQGGSQTFVMWKNRQMAANRRKFDPAALHIEGAPIEPEPPVVAARINATTPAPTPTATVATRATAAPATVTAAAAAEYTTANAQATPAPATAPAPAPNAINATVGAVVAANATNPATPPATTTAAAMPARPRPPGNADIIQRGGKFLPPAIVTIGSSATSKMAASRKRGDDPDLIIPADPAARASYEAAFARFADVFPDAFFITERARVYLDAQKEQENSGRLLSAGLHSMTGFFRDDGPLYDLVLDAGGQRELDRLWQEFFFAAAIPIRMHISFVWFERTDSSFMRDAEFDPFRPEDKTVSTQEKIKKLGEIYLAKAVKNNAAAPAQKAIVEHFEIVAATNLQHDRERAAAEASHLVQLQDFALRAYRRPLTAVEREKLLRFYRVSRDENGVDHEEAMRDCIASVLMSPHFCYRIDLVEAAGDTRQTQTGGMNRAPPMFASARTSTTAALTLRPGTQLLSSYALASRLSYFLWSSMPDEELLRHAASGELQKPDVLAAHARRMVQDPRARALATEFAGNWLDFRRFEQHNAVDKERFPAFDSDLRQAMFEEPVRFFLHVMQANRPVQEFLFADYTFANAPLARHYGFPEVKGGAGDWVRIDQASRYDRGGLLPMSVFLTANSPGLRTSPVKRGYWVVRRVLGERIPPPPAAVPDLPNDEKDLGDLTLRQVLAKHRADPSCASCHARFDSFGLVFEGFGPVGEKRQNDFGGRPVDTRAEFPGGKEATGLGGLRDYIRGHREKDFVDNLARKLLAYGLGRTLLMSDDALVAEMKANLARDGHRFGLLIDTIVTSAQFRTKRSGEPAAAPIKTTAN